MGWRGGPGCGRRRKPIHGGLAAASMPRTLPQPDPPRLRQVPAICHGSTPCVDEFRWKSNISILDRRASTRGVDLRVDQGRHLPTAAGNCRRRGTVGLRGVSGMDAATKPPGMDSRRPRTPTVPRHPTECRLLTLTLTLTLPWFEGLCGCRAPPCRTPPQPSPWMPPGACVGSRQRRTVRWKNRLFGSCSTVPSWPLPVSCSVV